MQGYEVHGSRKRCQDGGRSTGGIIGNGRRGAQSSASCLDSPKLIQHMSCKDVIFDYA